MTEPSVPSPDVDRRASGHEAEEEPVTTGTLFIMVLFLMALAGLWALMYLVLLDR